MEEEVEREHTTRADLRAERQRERRSGRGFPKQRIQAEVTKAAAEKALDRRYLSELGRRVPLIASVILSSVVTACDVRERELSVAEPPVDQFPSAVFSPGGPIPSPVPTPDDLGRLVSALPQEPERPAVIRSQEEARPTTTATPTAAEIQQKETPIPKKAGVGGGDRETLQNIESDRTHVVRSNEDLFAISRLYGIPWQIVYVKNFDHIGNNLDSVEVGDRLIIPSGEEINFVDQRLNKEGLTWESITCEGPYYFNETQHYVRSTFLEFFQTHGGKTAIGAPVSENVESTLQFFEKMAITKYGRDGIDFMNIGEITVYILSGKEAPEKGEFSLDQRFSQLYQSRGGEEVFGYAISDIFEENGVLVQYTQNARFELDSKTNEARLGDLGREFAEGWKERQRRIQWSEEKEDAFKAQPYVTQCDLSFESGNAFYEARRASEDFLMIHPEMINDHLVHQLSLENPEKLSELFHRSQEVMIITEKGFPNIYPEGFSEESARDWRIFKYHWGGDPENPPVATFEQVLGALLEHYYSYENNPLIQQALVESRIAAVAINRAILDKADPDWFVDNEVPLLPEDWQDAFVFAGGQHALGGGKSYYYPVLFGAYNEYRSSSLDDYSQVLSALSEYGSHELIHDRIQTLSVFPPHSGVIQSEETNRAGLILPENRRHHLAHMAMSSLTTIGQEALGFDPAIEPRIIYIFSVLKRAGIADPYGEIVLAAVTANSDRLWNSYEENRDLKDLSLDVLSSTNDPVDSFSYYSPPELEAFRLEYLIYLGN